MTLTCPSRVTPPTKRCPICKGRMHLFDMRFWFCIRCWLEANP